MKCSQRLRPRSWSGLHRADTSRKKKIDCLLIKMLRMNSHPKKIRENEQPLPTSKKNILYSFSNNKKTSWKNLRRGRGLPFFFWSPWPIVEFMVVDGRSFISTSAWAANDQWPAFSCQCSITSCSKSSLCQPAIFEAAIAGITTASKKSGFCGGKICNCQCSYAVWQQPKRTGLHFSKTGGAYGADVLGRASFHWHTGNALKMWWLSFNRKISCTGCLCYQKG